MLYETFSLDELVRLDDEDMERLVLHYKIGNGSELFSE